ncbi:MAG: carbohydrate porin, partial [Acetobacteraceae bacterium]|nr:carbohydrate porin [Acetobacteraceae bacterium]
LGLIETSEILGNPTGGRKTGAVYEGATEMSLGIDLGKAVGLQGGLLNVSAWQIRGRGLTTNNIDNLQLVSSIEADPATRLFEAWYQQSFLGGKLDIRLGQLAADQEFMITQYGEVFINETFGWPALPGVDLPAGGPSYPLATPGVRLRALPNERTTLLLGVFNGDPAANANFPPSDPQLRNPSGANLRFQGVWVIGEVQYAANRGENATGLPATYRFGGWYNSNAFTDQFFAVSGIAAAGPGAIPPGQHHGDWSLYGIVDQLVWRPAGSKERGVGVFLRAMGAPANRNEIVAFVDGGVTWKAPFGRDDDTVGLGFGWARISGEAIAAERAQAALDGHTPIQSAEGLLELTYQAQLAPWWVVQPDFQYIFNPGGGVLNSNGSRRVVGSAAVFGLRTVVTF